MKNIYKIVLLFIFAIGLSSCDKNENFEIQPKIDTFTIITPINGQMISLSDANPNNTALFVSWSVLSGSEGVTYNIEIAETGTDFEVPYLLGTSEGENFSMTVEELNTFLLDVMGITPEKAMSMDIRVLNGEEMTQTVAIIITPFKVEYEELFLAGSITDPAWTPESALPMTRLDVNLFEITVDLPEGAEFKFLPQNTGWDGDLGEDPDNAGHLIEDGEVNLSGYTAGKYNVSVDLNTFTFTVDEILPPANIAVPGNHQGWDPAVAPILSASAAGMTDFEGYVWLDGEYKFIAPDANGDFAWGNIDWGDDGSFTGILVENDEVNCNTTAGYYRVKADTDLLTYSAELTNWGVIGNATPGGWDADTDLTYDTTTNVWTVTLDLVAGEWKFRANDAWDLNYGDTGADGSLEEGGDNMVLAEDGNYTITLDLSTPRMYTYTIVKN